MPEFLQTALATPGLVWLALTLLAAGVVRGFAGFGSALIFVPIANIFLPAADVIAIMIVGGATGTVSLLPRALKQAEIKEVVSMAAAAALTVPLGLWVLSIAPQDTIRWIVSGCAAAMVGALIFGWRYHGRLDLMRIVAIGAMAGVMGGMTGLTGPVVILFYLASGAKAVVVRANTILYLALLDVIVIASMLLGGLIGWHVLGVALLLNLPYFLGTQAGQAMFVPRYENLYRRVAYGVICLAVLTGLPIWD
ncbi:sulfite exporter TauE/SafE family protein [Cognatishimia sp. SS12]|uniref:sulfite exporter TauE/SafE family protein n=1 Tax=Cognatishimia sp. SS12 TaxID=2979465 RepID=UPI00232E6112|nr:sulfite exporter TauE/SafE family protein [Cognatishimia sp. SS12]MDC0738532.1 sulfite exporter TauE/SafE family protein [Cognatishimia sp. SS12]